MKSKKLSKQLVLKRETVVNLGNREMSDVHGGIGTYTGLTCETNLDRCTAAMYCYETWWCTDPYVGICQGGSIPTGILCG